MLRYSKHSIIFILLFVVVLLVYRYMNEGEGEGMVTPSMFSSVIIYRTGFFDSTDLDSESLAKIPKVFWDEKSTHEIFNNVKYHRRNKRLWEVPSLAVAKLRDGTEKRIAITPVNGCLKIFGQRGYYVITGESRDAYDKKMEKVHQIWASKTNIPQAEEF